MKRKLIILAAALTLALSWSITACAQPEVMPDGTVFDAEYYAQIYPDVVAVFGTDANKLYLHYTQYGKAEYYIRANADVMDAVGTNPAALYQHYIKYGLYARKDFGNWFMSSQSPRE